MILKSLILRHMAVTQTAERADHLGLRDHQRVSGIILRAALAARARMLAAAQPPFTITPLPITMHCSPRPQLTCPRA